MTTLDKVRNRLIDRLLSIKNETVLEEIDKIVSNKTGNSDELELSKAQISMLEISEEDIKNGNIISQEAMNKRNLEWLNEM